MKYKTASNNTRTCEQEGRVAEGTRVGCVEHEEEAWSISYTNTLRALQNCKCKRIWTININVISTNRRRTREYVS